MGRLMHLSGKTILVTGATGEIGSAISRALAAEGARVLVHYGRNQAAADALAAELGHGALTIDADLADPAAPTQLWAKAEATGPIYALVNNAGIRSEVSVTDPLADWHAVWQQEMQINLTAAVDLTKAAILHFREEGGGRILNIASRAGQRGYSANALPYGVSKAGLINLTKSIARSFGGEGILCSAIAPGWVETRMAEEFIAQHGADAALSEIPIRQMATLKELGELAAFALRPSQRSLNGAVLDVNGASYTR
jgi:3-oxoacyl-[acyl-carrier protein] reductase